MSISGRTDTTKILKKVEKQKKKTEDLSRISSSHSEFDERLAFKPIDGEDVQSLSIRENDLKKLLNERQKPSEKKEPVLVKKANPNAYPTTEVKVAKLAPNRPLKEIQADYTDNLGIRFDKTGNCVPHSILGTVEDYLCEAVAHGKSIDLPYDTLDSDRPFADSYLIDGKQKQPTTMAKNFEFNIDGGEKALMNWRIRMNERKSVQDLVQNSNTDFQSYKEKSNRNSNELVMNQYDAMNKKNQINTLLDRTLPLVENGKGNRFGSEFWNQALQIGNDTNGITATLTKSQRGILPDIELIDKPAMTYRETHFDSKQPNLNTYPWSKSKYLEQRLKKLKPMINELIPHSVEFDELQVRGINPLREHDDNDKDDDDDDTKENPNLDYTWVNPAIATSPLPPPPPPRDNEFINDNGDGDDDDVLASYEDVVGEPIVGPCVIFGGQTAHWTGSETANSGVIALESRLNFETKATKRVLATFEIFNAGTCAIYYDWKKIKETNPFQIANPKEQRFYFDTRSSVILPGDALKLHIVFKSNKGGIFTEKWEFIPRPILLNGASLVLTLRGVALQEDKFKKRRISLEKNLFMREAEAIVKSIVDSILSDVQTPVRAPSPIDTNLIEDQVFMSLNEPLYYDYEIVCELKELYASLSNDSDQQWDLSIKTLKEKIVSLNDTDPEKCEEKLDFLNKCTEKLYFKPYQPNTSNAYMSCYNLWCSTLDEIYDCLSALKEGEGVQLPASVDTYPHIDEIEKKYEEWKKEYEVMKQIELERKARTDKGGKVVDKSKKVEKKEDKPREIQRKNTLPSPTKSRSSRRESTTTSRAGSKSPEKTSVPTIEKSSAGSKRTPIPTDEQIKRKQVYNQKAYSNVYDILMRMFDYMELIFEETITKKDSAETINPLPVRPILPLNFDLDTFQFY